MVICVNDGLKLRRHCRRNTRFFDPKAHGEWQRKMSGGKMTRWVDEGLLMERDER